MKRHLSLIFSLGLALSLFWRVAMAMPVEDFAEQSTAPAAEEITSTPQPPSPEENLPVLSAQQAQQALKSQGANVVLNPVTGLPDFISIDRRDEIHLLRAPSNTEEPQEVALSFFDEYRSLFRMDDPRQELKVEGIETDSLGMHHVRLSQNTGEWPMFGGELVVHLTSDNQVTAINGKITSQAKPNAHELLNSAQVFSIVKQYLTLEKGVDFSQESGVSLVECDLLVYNPALLDRGPDVNYMAYHMVIDDPEEPARWVVLVDAANGQPLLSYNDLDVVKNREAYDLGNSTSYPGTLCYNESGPVGTPSSDCVSAFDYAGETYDFYFSSFGRDSFDDLGGSMRSNVNYGNMYNAFWNGSNTTYGPGFAVRDVVAHEWTHGVTDYTADLVYVDQSGALNESFSDVMSVMVDDDDWLQGEDLPIGAIRSLADPAAYGDPGKLSDYYCTTSDNGGVHTNSSIYNHAAYLMAEGGTYNAYTITGIGRPATAQIYYRTLSVYLTSTSNFKDAYFATLDACEDLYGSGSETCNSVQDALDAVEMNTQVPPCKPVNLAPSNGAAQLSEASLAWSGYDPNIDTLTYDVYLEVNNPSPSTLLCDDTASLTCDTGQLDPASTYYWQVVANDGSATTSGSVWSLTTSDGQAASFPFSDGFDSGTLGTGWSIVSSSQGRVRLSSSYPYSGNYSALLEDAFPDGTYSTAALILTIDLEGLSDVTLDFWWREFSDENHSGDGVFVSEDGLTWYQVLSFNNGPSTYRQEIIDLDETVTSLGVGFNAQFKIKFQFYDNYSVSTDGYSIDEVQVTNYQMPDYLCENQSQIPLSECQALEAVYKNTGGQNWTQRTGWLETIFPCSWFGVSCTSGHISRLDLNDNNLNGGVPEKLVDLTELYFLDLTSNLLVGSIPTTLGNVYNLEYLDLSRNQLTGNIPAELGALNTLYYLDLSYNQLDGNIPKELGQIPYLLDLFLDGNQLTGSIPSQLEDINYLQSLSLSANQLSGGIPPELGNLTDLWFLDLSENQLSGQIPVSLSGLVDLIVLDLGYNTLSASDPDLMDFLNTKDSNWDQTQTVLPNGLQVVAKSGSSSHISWTQIAYTNDGGYYEVNYSTNSGGPYTIHGTTTDKNASSYIAEGLNPERTYYFRMRSHTPKHGNQQNENWSPYSAEITVTTPILQVASFPFYDGFEAGNLGVGWSVITMTQGQVQVSDFAYSAGESSVLLDDRVSDSNYSTAVLVLSIDLSGQSNATLEFDWQGFSDEDDSEDGVFISDNYGATWVKITSFNGDSSGYQHENVDLAAEAASNGLVMNDHFQIKFQFYDNYSIPADGYSIDEVRVASPPTPTATPVPGGSLTTHFHLYLPITLR